MRPSRCFAVEIVRSRVVLAGTEASPAYAWADSPSVEVSCCGSEGHDDGRPERFCRRNEPSDDSMTNR